MEKYSIEDNIYFLIYKFVEGIEELKVGNVEKKEYSKESLEKAVDILLKIFFGNSLKQKILYKTLMMMPWHQTLGLFYEFLLDLGKNKDGSYRSTEDTISSIIKMCLK